MTDKIQKVYNGWFYRGSALTVQGNALCFEGQPVPFRFRPEGRGRFTPTFQHQDGRWCEFSADAKRTPELAIWLVYARSAVDPNPWIPGYLDPEIPAVADAADRIRFTDAGLFLENGVGTVWIKADALSCALRLWERRILEGVTVEFVKGYRLGEYDPREGRLALIYFQAQITRAHYTFRGVDGLTNSVDYFADQIPADVQAWAEEHGLTLPNYSPPILGGHYGPDGDPEVFGGAGA